MKCNPPLGSDCYVWKHCSSRSSSDYQSLLRKNRTVVWCCHQGSKQSTILWVLFCFCTFHIVQICDRKALHRSFWTTTHFTVWIRAWYLHSHTSRMILQPLHGRLLDSLPDELLFLNSSVVGRLVHCTYHVIILMTCWWPSGCWSVRSPGQSFFTTFLIEYCPQWDPSHVL